MKRPCPSCRSPEAQPLFAQRFARIEGGSIHGGYDVACCRLCGTLYADGIPSQPEFDRYYQAMSKYESPSAAGTTSPIDQRRFAEIAALVAPHLPAGARVLEIGCASGGLLAELVGRGVARAAGIDPSPACARTARELYGLDVRAGSVFDDPFAGETFDALVLVGVLEHLVDVGRAFELLRRKLAPDGLVFFEVPDASRFAEFAEVPFQQLSVEHVNFFTPASLASLAGHHGFEVVASAQPVRDTGRRGLEPVVAMLLRRTEQAVASTADESGRDALARYLEASERLEAPHRKVVEALAAQARPVVVWSAGTQALRLVATSALGRVPIAAFIDGNPRYDGKSINGRPIVGPSQLARFSEPVLVASSGFQREIVEAIRGQWRRQNELVLLDAA